MANAYTSQILEDGVRNFIVKLTGVLDSSNVSPAMVVVSPSDCNPAYLPQTFRIDHIDYSISDGIEVQLLWEGTPDGMILPLAGRAKFNYADLGGILDSATSATGKIKLLTTGWTAGVQVYSVMLWLVKMGVPIPA